MKRDEVLSPSQANLIELARNSPPHREWVLLADELVQKVIDSREGGQAIARENLQVKHDAAVARRELLALKARFEREKAEAIDDGR